MREKETAMEKELTELKTKEIENEKNEDSDEDLNLLLEKFIIKRGFKRTSPATQPSPIKTKSVPPPGLPSKSPSTNVPHASQNTTPSHHQKVSQKYCHFFNNKSFNCEYGDQCRFRHERSPQCWHGQN